jgi:hypothetical protein
MNESEIKQRMKGWTDKCVINKSYPQVLVTIQEDGRLGLVITEDMQIETVKVLLKGVLAQL